MLNRIVLSKCGGYASFMCPACWFAHRLPIKPPGTSGWVFNGSIDRPTFTPSVKVTWTWTDEDENAGRRDRCCHSFVTDGRIQFLGDCTHKLAGQTVDLPPFPDNLDRSVH